MKFFIKSSLLLSICFGIVLINAGKTSADLIAEKKQSNNVISASTLSFSSVNTVNFDRIKWFFNIEGIKLDGYEIKPLIIKNEGKLDFNYSIRINKKNSDENICESISLAVMKDWEKIYDGPLTDLKLNQKISNNTDGNLIFVISMKQNADSLKEKQCNFDLEFRTWKNNPDEETKGLFAKQILTNTIKSGRW